MALKTPTLSMEEPCVCWASKRFPHRRAGAIVMAGFKSGWHISPYQHDPKMEGGLSSHLKSGSPAHIRKFLIMRVNELLGLPE